MKHRRLLLALPLLPTIAETLEDSVSLKPSAPQCTQSSQSPEDYMSSIQALARPVEAPSCGPVRLQRGQRTRLFVKNQMKHSASVSLPRASPRTLRTPRASAPEEFALSRERDCRGRDPVDWLFGQTQTLARTGSECT